MDNNYEDTLLIVFFFVLQYYFAYIIMLASIWMVSDLKLIIHWVV